MRLTVFASGSGGNCALLCGDGTRVLLDAGLSARRIRSALAAEGLRPEQLDGVLVTHEHTDHIAGLAVLYKQLTVPVYAPGTVAGRLGWLVPGVRPYLRPVQTMEPFALGAVEAMAFPTSHDTPQSVGYRLQGAGWSFALATDSGCVTAQMLQGLEGAGTVLLEANHDEAMLRAGPYPEALKRRILSERGHLSNAQCAALAGRLARSGTREIVLGHLSQENNVPSAAYAAVAEATAGTGAAIYVAPALGRLAVEAAVCCA